MCEFQRIKITPEVKELLPMCDYTKDYCTLCVLGNSKTYNEAVKKRNDNNAE